MENGDFSSEYGYRPHVVDVFRTPKTEVSKYARVEIFENGAAYRIRVHCGRAFDMRKNTINDLMICIGQQVSDIVLFKVVRTNVSV